MATCSQQTSQSMCGDDEGGCGSESIRVVSGRGPLTSVTGTGAIRIMLKVLDFLDAVAQRKREVWRGGRGRNVVRVGEGA